MNNLNKNKDSLTHLKSLLQTLFQLDITELDFGIYRIMNYRRKEIENFIEKDLIQAVEKEFERFKTQTNKEISEKIQETERKIKEDFGEEAIKNGQLIEKYSETKIGRRYLELKKQLDQVEITESIKIQVFNDLYNFFSRYYEDGDFISKRRYSSKQEKYAIPYNGEEVKLYWANFDQYYVKTGEIFKDYEFKLKDWRFIFRTAIAEVESGNVKGERRYFVLSEKEPIKIDEKQRLYTIQFEYKPLTDEEIQKFHIKTKSGEEKETGIKQDEINGVLKDRVLEQIKSAELKAILLEKKKISGDEEETYIDNSLKKYTKRVTSDFFIHKNLKGFLERELDYFIKTEVININNLDGRHITRAKVVEGIGKRIIEFLAQIEDFQKMLWEKKKFVLQTDYVITIDKIKEYAGEEFLESILKEILKNKEQIKEWKEIGFGDIKARNDLIDKKLPVDTRYFSQEFKEGLLEKLTEKADLDHLLDGVLIKSENWQALNLIMEKYKESVKTIYLDPPYNTGSDEFLYKDKYQHSSWLSMMYDRLSLGENLLKREGLYFVQIDYNESHNLKTLLDYIFDYNFLNEIVVSRIKKSDPNIKQFNTATDSIYLYSRTQDFILNIFSGETIEKETWHAFDAPGQGEARIFFGKKILPPRGRHWMWDQNKIEEAIKQGRIRLNSKSGKPEYLVEAGRKKKFDSNWLDISTYSFNWNLATEKNEKLIYRIIMSGAQTKEIILDYFLGSGTTTAVAHKLGRRWIGIEMDNYFRDIPLKRMKEVLAGYGNHEPCGISKDINWQGGGFFKYHYIEQYEDTLHNIEFLQAEKGQKALELFGKGEGNEYLMRYFLRYETDGSQSLLNLKNFENPFEYKLKIISVGKGEEIVNVDLIETFNYLIGLKINKYKFLKENGRKYVFVFGEKNHRKIAVVWRQAKNIDLKKDREIIKETIKNFNPEEIFINGDALVENYKVIEKEFKAAMGV